VRQEDLRAADEAEEEALQEALIQLSVQRAQEREREAAALHVLTTAEEARTHARARAAAGEHVQPRPSAAASGSGALPPADALADALAADAPSLQPGAGGSDEEAAPRPEGVSLAEHNAWLTSLRESAERAVARHGQALDHLDAARPLDGGGVDDQGPPPL